MPTGTVIQFPVSMSVPEGLLYSAWLAEQFVVGTGEEIDFTDEQDERMRLWNIEQKRVHGRDFVAEWRRVRGK